MTEFQFLFNDLFIRLPDKINHFLFDPSGLKEKFWVEFFFHLSCSEKSVLKEELLVENELPKKELGDEKELLVELKEEFGEENQEEPTV